MLAAYSHSQDGKFVMSKLYCLWIQSKIDGEY